LRENVYSDADLNYFLKLMVETAQITLVELLYDTHYASKKEG